MSINPQRIFDISNEQDFETVALEVFRYQASCVPVYRDFISYLGVDPAGVTHTSQVPFMPVEFFKSHPVTVAGYQPEITFTSSGTTGMVQSRHLVTDVSLYVQSFRKAFGLFYGDIAEYAFLALLPAYQEREGSSLIYMVDDLIARSGHPFSGYVLSDPASLAEKLELLRQQRVPVILIGVTYALLDFVEAYRLDFPGLIVMETGGMKGRRKEMVREELHQRLCRGFGVPAIHSEYGMTELLSQGYSAGGGLFRCPPWMKILLRDINDPLTLLENGKTGGINVIDLANVHSCAFIATQDLGRMHPDTGFEVLGRFDNSDIRGCNLLVQ
ncbi:acyl transferase [Hufsiella ginkgonis]|uniref:acyl transferase n=1 Tax=Hufsiella ginkgonis TaxID=2695274 RepID=UPI0034E2841B